MRWCSPAALCWPTRARRWRWPEALALAGVVVLYVSQVPARPFYAIFVIAWYALFAISENVAVFIAAEILAAGGAGHHLGARRDRARRCAALLSAPDSRSPTTAAVPTAAVGSVCRLLDRLRVVAHLSRATRRCWC